ncbi:MAG: RtcB family protein [Verrucomicrobiae bacterium]|nr:RtcB family protein [Verrucomicrobiae bacterium]
MNAPPPNISIIPDGPATGFIPAPGNQGKPITVIANETIRKGFDAKCLQQAINSRAAPGVTDLVLNPDAHAGYGAPVGCVMVSPSHIYPGPVGVDIKCSMSLLQLDVPAEGIQEKSVRRALINAIGERIPTGAGRGQRSVKKSRRVNRETGRRVVVEGASPAVCAELGIPPQWAEHCEDSFHRGHDGTGDALAIRQLEQKQVDAEFAAMDILTNCRMYPRDEAPAAYKNFPDVIDSVEQAGLAKTVANLRARFVIKDADDSMGGAA